MTNQERYEVLVEGVAQNLLTLAYMIARASGVEPTIEGCMESLILADANGDGLETNVYGELDGASWMPPRFFLQCSSVHDALRSFDPHDLTSGTIERRVQLLIRKYIIEKAGAPMYLQHDYDSDDAENPRCTYQVMSEDDAVEAFCRYLMAEVFRIDIIRTIRSKFYDSDNYLSFYERHNPFDDEEGFDPHHVCDN